MVASGAREIPLQVDGREIVTLLEVSERDRKDILAGGTLNFVKHSR
jgi:aconitate hydratase